jgi:cof-like hydrolase
VRFLADYYRVPIEDVIAIGDNINDIPMIEAAGLGVAVGNAVQPLKDAADEVTLTNNQNAVAHIIEKYGMGENP